LKRIPSIDGLRAISILFVIVGHLAGGLGTTHRFGPITKFFFNLFGNGFLGVSIFFVISGFLITTLLLREYDKTQRISLSDFYFRRAFRILPPLYAYIAFVAISAHWTGLTVSGSEILVALTFTRNLIFHPHAWQFEHFWSLCIEEQFYLLWPLALIWALRKGGRATAVKLSVVLIVLAPIFRVAAFVMIHQPLIRRDVHVLLFCRMDALMFGCLAALTLGAPGFERIYDLAAKRIWIFPLFTGVISNLLWWHFENYYAFPIGITLDGISIALFLVWCTRNPQSIAGRFLNYAPVVHIGLISYSIYIWQTYFLQARNTTFMGRFPFSVLFILLAAEISWYTVERWSRSTRDALEPVIFRKRAVQRRVADAESTPAPVLVAQTPRGE
jgi:peptidoglycan/LPS O-acetylase OafA/YrhL